MADWGTIILAVIGSLGLWETVRFFFVRRSQARVTDASADKTLAEARAIHVEADNRTLEGAYRLIEQLNRQMVEQEHRQNARFCELEAKLLHYARRLTYLMDGIRKLHAQIRGANQDPCWTPDEWDPDAAEDGGP